MTHIHPPVGSATLVARGISKSHGAHVVLDDVSVTVGAGTKLGVVGPNGVGKSTLLRIMAGLDRPDGGTVTVAPATATVGYLDQEHERIAGETVRAHLARRTGVAAAELALGAATEAVSGRRPDADDAYATALERWLALGAPELDARVATTLVEVGLDASTADRLTTTLSGGEAARVALAAVLLSRFDVLLLDEPTNDLDFGGLDLLEAFVGSRPGGLAVVSHDREFLRRTIASVLELDEASHRASVVAGGWDAYLHARAVARRHQEEAYAEYQATRHGLMERARRQRQWAVQGVRREVKAPRDNDKQQRDWRINRTEKQAARVRASEKALTRLEEVDKPWQAWNLRFEIATARRSGDVVVALDDAVVERGDFRMGPFDLEIGWAERVGVLGPNGSGKTTLIDVICGRVPLVTGERRVGPGVIIGELDQARSRFLGARSLLDAFLDITRLRPDEARSVLAKFALGADEVSREASTLSPGERTRAALALLMAGGVNCLILDEPTNHLDLPAIEQLEVALAGYDGTLILVTHDRRLLDSVELTRQVQLPL